MAGSAESIIAEALFEHLKGATGLWCISWSNINFKPSKSGRYLRVSFQPNETQSSMLSEQQHDYRGLLQVLVVTKPSGGLIKPMEQAAKVVDRFQYLTTLSTSIGTLRISRQPSIAPGLQTGSTYEVPVTIPYELFAEKDA